MISIYKLKPRFQELLRPMLTLLHKAGVTANQITISSIILSAVIGICFWFGDKNKLLFLALPAGLLLRMALNALDGMMAKTYNQSSKAGELLNEVGDVVSDLFIFFPLLKFGYPHVYVVVVFMCLSVVNEFCGVLANAISGVRRYDGPMGKSDRAFVVAVFGILKFFEVDTSRYFLPCMLIVIVLLILSTIVRVKRTLSQDS